MEASVLKEQFNPNVYNGLWTVEEANKQVNRNDYQDKADFLKKSAYLLAKYDLKDKLGIRLLHKHNEIESDERMIESEAIVNDEKALITEPVKNSFGNKSVPGVWKIVDGNFYPLEFTNDPLACQLYSDLEIPDGFLNDYRNQVNSSPIGKYLGISIVKRKFFETDNPENFPLEYSDAENRSNVIFLRPRREINKSIQTSWSFHRNIDIKLACKSDSYCVSNCWTGCKADTDADAITQHEKFHKIKHKVAYEHTYVE